MPDSQVLRILTAILCLSWTVESSVEQLWQAQRDDLAEYRLDAELSGRHPSECALKAQPEHQAVQFVESFLSCRFYACQRGWSGCRKCRHAANNSLPLLLVRPLDRLAPRTCWRTFQHRVDGSVDFYRTYSEYESEFGQGEDGNYWMGLGGIHLLTRTGDRRVRWEVSAWNGSWWWWENQFFSVQGAEQGYRVSLGALEADRSSVFPTSQYLDGQRFTTKDRDQDSWNGNCAVRYYGAWWYRYCHIVNPNGRYFTADEAVNPSGSGLWAKGLTLTVPGIGFPLNHEYSMRIFECMVIDYL